MLRNSILIVFSYVALAGCLVFLLAECLSPASKGTTMFAGVPTGTDSTRPKSYLMLSGRLLIVPLFIVTMQFELGFVPMFWNVAGIILVPLVAIGCAYTCTTIQVHSSLWRCFSSRKSVLLNRCRSNITRVVTFMRVDRFKYALKNANKICKICE